MLDRAWFWNRIARRYAGAKIADEDIYQRKIEATRARLTPHSVVLEFGCGTGTTAVSHAPHLSRIDAVDVSANMLEIAHGRAAEAGVENITFHEATVQSFSAPPESYDMVMMHSLLHLVDDPGGAVAKAARLLKPGGWLVSSTALIGEDGMHRIRLAILPASFLGLLPRLTKFTSDELRAMHAGAGLEIVEDWKPGPRKALFLVARKP